MTLWKLGIFFSVLITFCNFNTSFAARRAFIQTQDTELLSAGDVELESWVWVKQPKEGEALGWLWFSPVFSLTNQLELSLPFELNFNSAKTSMSNANLEIKLLLTDSVSLDPWRVAVKFLVQKNFAHPKQPKTTWLGLSIIQSYGDIKGSHATLDISGYGNWLSGTEFSFLSIGLGYTYKLNKMFRLGAEYSGEFPNGTEGLKKDSQLIGPNFSYTRGSTWLTVGHLVGLSTNSPNSLYRLIWGTIL